ncbi:MAG: hypothetical protein ACE5OZ_06745 [Candidatus Heimdallarchaeota archaeon]
MNTSNKTIHTVIAELKRVSEALKSNSISDTELLAESGFYDVIAEVREIGRIELSSLTNANASKMGYRIRHQIGVYSVLKYLDRIKRNGLDALFVKPDALFVKPTKRVFKINLLDGNEGEMINEIANLFEHISGVKRWIDPNLVEKAPSSFRRKRAYQLDKWELSYVTYYGLTRAQWNRVKETERNLWIQRQREMMIKIWEEITNKKISNNQRDIALRKDELGYLIDGSYSIKANFGRTELSDPNIGVKKLERIISLFRFKIDKLPKPIDIGNLLESIAALDGDDPLTRGQILNIYLKILNKFEIRLHLDNSLFSALLHNREKNSQFFENLCYMNVVLEDGTVKSLRRIMKEGLSKAKKITLPSHLFREYLKERVNELKSSNLFDVRGNHVFDMKMGQKKQKLKGVDHEEVLSEIAELVLWAAIDNIIQSFPDADPESKDFLDVYKKLKEGELLRMKDKSISPGFRALSRPSSVGNKAPLDHLLFHEGDKLAPILLIISDKKTAIYENRIKLPPSQETKADLLNSIYWSERKGDRMIWYDREKRKWKHYQEGLSHGIQSIERKRFFRLFQELKESIGIKQLLVFRNMFLCKENGRTIFKISIQVGKLPFASLNM